MSGLLRVLGRALSEFSPRCGFGYGRDWCSGGAWSCPLQTIWLGLGLTPPPPPCGRATRRGSQGARYCPPKHCRRWTHPSLWIHLCHPLCRSSG